MYRCDLRVHVDKVATGADVLDAVEIGNIDVSDGGMDAIIDLREEISINDVV